MFFPTGTSSCDFLIAPPPGGLVRYSARNVAVTDRGKTL